MKLLLVEDDEKIAKFVLKGLQYSGYIVDHVDDGAHGFDLAMSETYDAAIIDVMLPKMNGLDIIEQLREENVLTPVIIISSKDSVDDRVRGLQVGGDDYLVKPFAFTELLARVQALIRRATSTAEPSGLTVYDITLDFLKRKISRSGINIELQPREFVLLEYFMRNPGRILSQIMILEHVWDYNFDPETNVVEVLVHRLREKIDKPFDNKLIHTVRGIGYVLEDRS